MKTAVLHSALFALISLILAPLAVAHASPSSTDSEHFCLPFDYEQWRRNHPRPAGKQLANLDVGEPRTVRMIYFLPNDRPYDAALVDLMKTRMRQMQAFYAEQMEAHGYGHIRFRFETDAVGEPLVHRVDGQHPNSYYWVVHQMASLVLGEVEQTFDLGENIYFIVIDDAVVWSQVGGKIGRNGGFALIPGLSLPSTIRTAEHELGHAFGLLHDFRDGDYIMSYGYDGEQDRLSACNARSLSVHPYFNSKAAQTEPPTIELTSPLVYTGNATTVPVRIKVRDSDGLHQVVLFVGNYSRATIGGDVSGASIQLKECRGLEGEKEAVVEFDYDGGIPSRRGSDFDSFRTQLLVIQAIDALGNVTFSETFELVNAREFSTPVATLTGPVTGWEGQTHSVSFSPDGRLLASGGIDGTIKLWEVSSRETVATLTGHEDQTLSVSFSPDGRLLASGGYDGTIKLWEVSSRETVATLTHESGEYVGVRSAVFSPDGRLLASGGYEEYLVKLWDVSSRELVATLTGHRGSVNAAAFSSDGRLLASAGGGTVRLWNVSSRELVALVALLTGPDWALSFSPDGRLLASAGIRENSEVKLWNVATGETIATLSGSAPVSFSPNGSLLASGTGSGGQTVRLRDVSSHETVATLAGHEGGINAVSFSPDGQLLASAASDGTIKLWDMAEWAGSSEQPIPQTLTKASGDGQEGTAGEPLAKPFVVSVLDQYGSPLTGVVVSFSVTAGGGTLSATTATTDANGRARSTLTLGSELGTNTVTATVEGLEPVTFTAIGQATTDSDGEVADDDSDGEVADDDSDGEVADDDSDGEVADDDSDGEDQQEPEGQPTTAVEFDGISSSHDSVREDDGSVTITLTVTLDKAAGTGGETVALAIVSPTIGKRAKRGEDFDATLDETITIPTGRRVGTAQLILTPKDNTTADGDKALAVDATSSSGHRALINIKIIDDEIADGEEDDGQRGDEMAFGFAGKIEDQAYTAGAAISALVLPEATGGEGEVTHRVSGLPAGLAFDAATRTISGTPEAATDGAVEIAYTAEDSAGEVATLTFFITVNPALSFGDLFDLLGEPISTYKPPHSR